MTFPAGDGARVAVNVDGAGALLDLIAERAEAGRGCAVATLNLDHLVKMRGDPAFRQAYLETDFVVADGNPVVWMSQLAQRPVSLAPGSELIEPLCALAARRGLPIALLGARAETLERSARALEAQSPGLRVVARIAPPYGYDPASDAADAHAAEIRDSGARLCFVALGAPKQEIFSARARAHAPQCCFFSIGAGLDFLAGDVRRAPPAIRRIKLEWAWRMLGSPRRLAGRYLRCAMILPGLAADAWRLRSDRSAPRPE